MVASNFVQRIFSFPQFGKLMEKSSYPVKNIGISETNDGEN